MVLWPNRLDDALRASVGRYVTQWGRDPVVGLGDQQSIGAEPDVDAFPRATEVSTAVALPETAEVGPVDVAAHAVEFAPERDAWSCGVELSAGDAYRPFVRLAVARYQPNALPQAALSPVVLLDWAQLAPDRAVTITHDPDVQARVHVTVTGNTYPFSATAESGSRIEATVQQRYNPLPVELGWVELLQFNFGQPEVGAGSTLLWRAAFDLPDSSGRGPFRVVIKELEDWPSDSGTSPRIAYLDVLPLPVPAPEAVDDAVKHRFT